MQLGSLPPPPPPQQPPGTHPGGATAAHHLPGLEAKDEPASISALESLRPWTSAAVHNTAWYYYSIDIPKNNEKNIPMYHLLIFTLSKSKPMLLHY